MKLTVVRSLIVAVVMASASLLFPEMLRYYSNSYPAGYWWLYLVSSTWSISIDTVNGFSFAFSTFNLLLFFGFNYIFAFEVWRFSLGKTSKRSTLAWGILSITPGLLMGLPILWLPDYSLTLPIPALLITGLIMMRLAGPKGPTTPWDGLEKIDGDS